MPNYTGNNVNENSCPDDKEKQRADNKYLQFLRSSEIINQETYDQLVKELESEELEEEEF